MIDNLARKTELWEIVRWARKIILACSILALLGNFTIMMVIHNRLDKDQREMEKDMAWMRLQIARLKMEAMSREKENNK